jgi:hypothetical protein
MKADAIKRYFETPRSEIRARMLSEAREAQGTSFEVEVEVDLPQRPLHEIQGAGKNLAR